MSLALDPSTRSSRPRRLPTGVRAKLFAYALVAPVVLLIIGLVAYPFFFAIYVSFTDQVVGSVGKFIGFDNFIYLSKSSTFTTAIWNTVIIVLVSDGLKLLIGLGPGSLGPPGHSWTRPFPLVPYAALGNAGLRRLPHLARAVSADRRRH